MRFALCFSQTCSVSSNISTRDSSASSTSRSFTPARVLSACRNTTQDQAAEGRAGQQHTCQHKSPAHMPQAQVLLARTRENMKTACSSHCQLLSCSSPQPLHNILTTLSTTHTLGSLLHYSLTELTMHYSQLTMTQLTALKQRPSHKPLCSTAHYPPRSLLCPQTAYALDPAGAPSGRHSPCRPWCRCAAHTVVKPWPGRTPRLAAA